MAAGQSQRFYSGVGIFSVTGTALLYLMGPCGFAACFDPPVVPSGPLGVSLDPPAVPSGPLGVSWIPRVPSGPFGVSPDLPV